MADGAWLIEGHPIESYRKVKENYSHFEKADRKGTEDIRIREKVHVAIGPGCRRGRLVGRGQADGARKAFLKTTKHPIMPLYLIC
jgi:hypothetical protein